MLAIVIPYYKHFFFDATLASLSIQTNMHFKVYIGDDASPESPNDLLEKYKGKFDFEYCRFQGNLGGISLVQQWKRCITMTHDEKWIMILGDDDVLQENCVASFYANLSEINANDCKVVRFATQVINQDNKLISDIFYHPKIENSVEFVMRKLKGHTRSSLSEYIFDKNKLITTQFRDFPLAWYSDLLGVLEFSDFKNIFTINEALVYFRLSGQNISSKNDNLVNKNIATYAFYYYLIDKKSRYFNALQKHFLLHKLEKVFLDNKRNVHFWKTFTKLYFSRIYIKRYFNLILKMGQMVIEKYTS